MSLGLGILLSTLLICLLLVYRWFGQRWNLKKLVARIAVILTGLIVITSLAVWGYVAYTNRLVMQTKYYGVELGASRDQVKYVMGYPKFVFGSKTDSQGMLTSINANEIPSDKSLNDYPYWGYELGSDQLRVLVKFDAKLNKVVSVGCFSTTWNCEPLLGITSGMSEDTILTKLGKPSSERIDDVTKLMEYKNFNVAFRLEKRTVFNLYIRTTGANE